MKFVNLMSFNFVFLVGSFSLFASEATEHKPSSLVTVLDSRGNETEIDRSVLIAKGIEGLLQDRFNIQADIVWTGRTMAASNVRYMLGGKAVGIRYYRETSTLGFNSWDSEKVSLSICRALGFSKSADELIYKAKTSKNLYGQTSYALASPAAVLHDNLAFNKLQSAEAYFPDDAFSKALASFACL